MCWINRADIEPEYVLSLDTNDDSVVEYKRLFPVSTKYFAYPNRSAIDAINNGAGIATGDLFIVVSDDFDCPEHWDTLLLNELNGKSDFLVKTQDLLQPTLITLPIMDRTYYNRFGYVYHPDYLHMYCDQEMTAAGHLLGRVITSSLVFEHKHYSTGKNEMDAISTKNDSTWGQGERVFNERLSFNFGIANPVMQYRDIKWR